MYALDQAVIATPVGRVLVQGTDTRITAIRVGADASPRAGSAAAVRAAAEQLEAWFAGTRTHFDLPLEPARTPRGGTLRDGIAAIGYGETLSYGALARQLGSSPRAIGQACARNPFPLVIPCHRVLAGGGRLGAYSAGEGPATKQWLLDHERRHGAAA